MLSVLLIAIAVELLAFWGLFMLERKKKLPNPALSGKVVGTILAITLWVTAFLVVREALHP